MPLLPFTPPVAAPAQRRAGWITVWLLGGMTWFLAAGWFLPQLARERLAVAPLDGLLVRGTVVWAALPIMFWLDAGGAGKMRQVTRCYAARWACFRPAPHRSHKKLTVFASSMLTFGPAQISQRSLRLPRECQRGASL